MSGNQAHADMQRLQQALARARDQARTTGRTVLDELLDFSGGLDLSLLSDLTGVASISANADELRMEALPLNGPGVAIARTADGRERLAMADPWDEMVVSRVIGQLGRYIEPVAVTTELLKQATAPTKLALDSRPIDRTADAQLGVVEFVNRAIVRAFADGASDIHFECDRVGVGLKLRLDGVMAPAGRLEGVQRAEEVISRIKVMAQLDITERRLPQDGRFRFEEGQTSLDLRVSIMPSVFGEDAVLRLLDKSQLRSREQQVTLDALGFDAANAQAIRWLSNLPNGMLLVTGPTGSGKTTTVYAALSEINTGLEKIITIEDPVEYELPGVLQIPVNERKGLTFAKGLRSILRHDPDRILVGEIRDAETAEIAVQSSLTGHLVFTTVHANSVFDVIGRFRHFGMDMFGFVSSLNGVVVQRLIRRLCPECSGAREAAPVEAAWLESHGQRALCAAIPRVVGCPACNATGYRGRFVIAEVHKVSDRLRDLIMRQADVSELKQAAFEGEVVPLLHHALSCLRTRQTSLEEIFRVVGQV